MNIVVFVCLELIVDNVIVIYNNGYIVIYDVSFLLMGGIICVLVGVNGSGKFILFKSIMG